MRKIFKYSLKLTDYQEIQMPNNPRILTVDVQHSVVCLWALVDTDQPLVSKTIKIAGTGHPIEEKDGYMDYIGTVQIDGGALIFHVFEVVIK